jgi:hypothetical protein
MATASATSTLVLGSGLETDSKRSQYTVLVGETSEILRAIALNLQGVLRLSSCLFGVSRLAHRPNCRRIN